MNTIFYGFEGVKEGCEGEVQSENLAGGEWARCGSPPMTPGMFVTSFFPSIHNSTGAYSENRRVIDMDCVSN